MLVESLQLGIIIQCEIIDKITNQAFAGVTVERVEIPSPSRLRLQTTSGSENRPISSPPAKNVRPLRLLAASVQSHTTSGATCSGPLSVGMFPRFPREYLPSARSSDRAVLIVSVALKFCTD
jgi:hypothetical protein